MYDFTRFAIPATGEQTQIWPWIVGGIALVALIGVIILSVMQKKGENPPTPPQEEVPPEAPAQEDEPTDDDA